MDFIRKDKLDLIRVVIKQKKPDLENKYPWLRPYLLIKSDYAHRVKYLWATLRYETRTGIQRRRKDPKAPLFPKKYNVLYIVRNITIEENIDHDRSP